MFFTVCHSPKQFSTVFRVFLLPHDISSLLVTTNICCWCDFYIYIVICHREGSFFCVGSIYFIFISYLFVLIILLLFCVFEFALRTAAHRNKRQLTTEQYLFILGHLSNLSSRVPLFYCSSKSYLQRCGCCIDFKVYVGLMRS